MKLPVVYAVTYFFVAALQILPQKAWSLAMTTVMHASVQHFDAGVAEIVHVGLQCSTVCTWQ